MQADEGENGAKFMPGQFETYIGGVNGTHCTAVVVI